MKAKCSFILRALTALVLAVLMLFGTVTTSVAAVVDDLAKTGYYWSGGTYYMKGSFNSWGELSGTNNSSNTQQHYYYIYTNGSSSNADITFKFKEENGSGNDSWFGAGDSDSIGTSGKQIYENGGSDIHLNRKNLGTTSTTWYKVKVWFEHASDCYCWYEIDTTKTALTSTITTKKGSTSTTSFEVNDTVSLSTSTSNNFGTVTYTYRYKKGSGSWNNISGTSFTPTSAGTYTIEVTANDGAVVSGTNSESARTATTTKEITVTEPACTPVIKNEAGTAELANTTIYSRQTLKFKVTDPNSHTSTLSITKGGTAQTASTYLSSTTSVASGTVVTFTPTALSAGASDVTYVITQSCSGSGSDSVTITVKAEPTVYFKRGSNTAIQGGQDGDKSTQMTYSAAASTTAGGTDGHVVFALTDYSFGDTTATYWAIYNGTKNISYNTGITSSTSNKNLGQTGITTVDLSSSSSTITPYRTKDHYNIYYDLITGKFYIEYPLLVTYKYTLDNSTSTEKTTAYIPYNTTASTKDCSVTGYTPSSGNTWYNEVGCTSTFNFSTKLTADKTLFTPLSPINYSLQISAGVRTTSSNTTYTLNDTITGQLTMAGSVQALQGTTGAKYQAKDVAYNSTCTLVAPDKSSSGYVFLGWYEDNTLKSTSAQYTYTHTMGAADTTLVARYDRKYTLTISAGTGGKVNTNQTSDSKTVYYNDAPGSFTINPNSGYEFDSANSTNLSTYYTVSGTSATGKSASEITDANKVNKTITVAFKAITYPVQITAFKMDNATAGYVPFTSGTPTPTVAGTTVTSNTVPYSGSTVTVTKNSTTPEGYTFVGWYYTTNVSSNVTSIPADYTYSGTGDTKTFTPNGTAGSTYYRVIALYRKNYYITVYNSYVKENGDFTFVAAPPKKVVAGGRTYNYAAGTLTQRGENNEYDNLKNGTALTEHIVSTNGATFYEGNKLLVYAGETIELTYSGLASSDAIRGVFFNNDIRYTNEKEPDNLYTSREYQGTPSGDDDGTGSDDNWVYTYLPATTLYANGNYYDTTASPYSNILGKTYVATVNQDTHKVTWTADQDYYNIDLELSNKYQIHINNDNWDGISISGMNDEGYYSFAEQIGRVNNSGTAIDITLDNPAGATSTYSFGTASPTVKKKDGTVVNDVTVTRTPASGTITKWTISGASMPAYDLYITIDVVETCKMRLSNVIISDSIDNKGMLTQTNGTNVPTDPTSAQISSATGHVGTITAVVKNSAGETVTADISKDSGNHWYYPDQTKIVEDNNYSNNYYLKGGVNKTGTSIAAGNTVTYTFTFDSGMDAKYSFIGWFEGSYDSTTGQFTPNYNKKLSGNTTYTHTATKDTVIIAVGTRDMYLGGNFTKAGVYSTTDTTWSQNRILMNFDPTYVNPNDSSKKGRYYYTFETVSPNTEYKFRCYDTASGTDTENLEVWKTWSNNQNNNSYGQNNDDILFGRSKYSGGNAGSHGAFVYKTNTSNFSLSENDAENSSSTKNHLSLGYAAPVTVYFYAYDGGISVNSTYQWSKAYISPGVGVDVTNASEAGNNNFNPTFNGPVVFVENKTIVNGTVSGADVTGTTGTVTFGSESVYTCTVKQDNGVIRVTACPKDNNLDVDAFVVYNLDSKKADAVKTITATTKTISSKTYNAFYADITVKANTKVYIVPIYKFTDTYMSTAANNMEEHTVYVNTEDVDKSVWGGLVSMYSWGTNAKLSSGNYPGQLLIPSNDGKSFYGQLQYYKGGLGGVLFDNYCSNNFISNYYSKKADGTSATDDTDRISTTVYCNNTANVQTYDYREPISIIDNINDNLYEDENMDLTFALKKGNKTSNPADNATNGDSSLAGVASWQYLTDRSGAKRVDLNGDVISTNPTATYKVVCKYTKDYNGFANNGAIGSKRYKFNEETRNGWSIDWYVYDNTNALINNGSTALETSDQSGTLSASFTDIEQSYMMTDIAAILKEKDYPVSGKAVMIAYENPTAFDGGTVRYSGQWYADGVNNPIEANVRVGIYADGAYTVYDTNDKGYGKATVSVTGLDANKGEQLITEDGCEGNSMAVIIKSRATNGQVSFTVDSTTNFLGWYYEVTDDEGNVGYEPLSAEQTISPSFNSKITYYAFYNASASYVFRYRSRNGNYKSYTAKGSDLTTEEMSAGGMLDVTTRAADIALKFTDITGIKVFNKTFTYGYTTPDGPRQPYTLVYTDNGADDTNTLTVKGYNSAGTLLEVKTTVTGTWATPVGLDESYVSYKPAENAGYVFVGWAEQGKEDVILSTKPNFGYSVVKDMTIVPIFGPSRITDDTWHACIDKNVTTQELTSESSGTLYNDSLISFRYARSTNMRIDMNDENVECGIVILAQSDSADATQKSNFDGAIAKNYLAALKSNNVNAAKMNSTKYGTAYAYYVTTDSLSTMNRADIYQAFDYATFKGGKFKVISYYKNGDTYVYSSETSTATCSGTLTP